MIYTVDVEIIYNDLHHYNLEVLYINDAPATLNSNYISIDYGNTSSAPQKRPTMERICTSVPESPATMHASVRRRTISELCKNHSCSV